jgi:serine/threonine protein kinase
MENGEEFKENYEVIEEIGKGSYGVVNKVVEKENGKKYDENLIS